MFDPRSGRVEFVVEKVVLGCVSPSTSVSLAHSHSTNCPIFISRTIFDAKNRSGY
jgi:hypothetical protein